jgi:hypothetical protein
MDERSPGDMAFVEHSAEIDLRDWIFFPTDERNTKKPDGPMTLADVAMAGFAAVATKVLQEQFQHQPPSLDFPINWAIGKRPSDGRGGPPPSDPVTLYVDLPLGAGEENACSYSCSLEAVVDDLIDGHKNHIGKIDNIEAIEIMGKIAARLRELAAKLDDACSAASEAA